MVKYAVSAYIADGNTTDYLITWDYLDEDHIVTYVNGTASYDPTSDFTATKINSTTIRVTDEFGAAMPSGAEIEIRRETPIQNRAVTFSDGSALLAEDLNKNSDYLLYSMQEVLDTVEAAAQDGALAAQVATEALRDETIVLRDTTEGYKNETLTARNTTQTYLATVDADATAADNHRIAAAASEASALSSKNAAAASQTAAANSATASANSAAASLSSEQASAASQTAAASSASNAAASAAAALISKNAAVASAADAAASFDSFDDRYLGSKASAPTVDNDGNALLTGALYWNSTNDTMYVYNGASWDSFNSTTGIADAALSTVITLTSDSKVGISTSTPDARFEVSESNAGVGTLGLFSNSQLGSSFNAGAEIKIGRPDIPRSLNMGIYGNGSSEFHARIYNTETGGALKLGTQSTDRMVIDAAGDTTFIGSVASTGRVSGGHIGEWQKRFVKSLSSRATITYTSSYYFSWDERIIGILAGESSTTTTNGYFDIIQPPSGTVIHGIGSANSDRTASSSGIRLEIWEALYYELPLGSNNTSQDGNFHWGYYSHINTDDIPDNWVLVAWVNGDAGTGMVSGALHTCCQGRNPVNRGTRDYPDSDWIYPALGNGWSGYGSSYGSPRYRRLNNIVHFEGLMTGGNPSTSTPVLYFPVGFRPVSRTLKIVIHSGGYGRLDVDANGAFYMYQGSGSWMECNFTFLANQ